MYTGGPFEANGNLADDFDILHDDLWMGQDSYEKAQRIIDGGSHYKPLWKREISKKKISNF